MTRCTPGQSVAKNVLNMGRTPQARSTAAALPSVHEEALPASASARPPGRPLGDGQGSTAPVACTGAERLTADEEERDLGASDSTPRLETNLE